MLDIDFIKDTCLEMGDWETQRAYLRGLGFEQSHYSASHEPVWVYPEAKRFNCHTDTILFITERSDTIFSVQLHYDVPYSNHQRTGVALWSGEVWKLPHVIKALLYWWTVISDNDRRLTRCEVFKEFSKLYEAAGMHWYLRTFEKPSRFHSGEPPPSLKAEINRRAVAELGVKPVA